jgi:hypothetical protein
MSDINQFVNNSLIAIIPIFSILLIGLIIKVISWVGTKINNSNVTKYLEIAKNAVTNSVNALSQTTVEALKKAGAFTPEKQKEVFETAKTQIINIIGEAGMIILSEVMGDVELWIETSIEGYLKDHKVEIK